jgi:Response regulator containing CheY-like receiver domain and AraC-type DNA-binding domain
MPTALIADDSMFQRLVLSKIAKAEGFDVLEAKNGQECLDILRSQSPDIALLDINMPVLSGMEVLEAAQATGHASRIVVISADIQDTTRQRCLDHGVRAMLPKPPQEDAVRAELRRVLAGD